MFCWTMDLVRVTAEGIKVLMSLVIIALVDTSALNSTVAAY